MNDERPNYVYVGAMPYNISFRKKDLDVHGDVFGVCDNQKLRIIINKHRPLAQQQDTMIHEVLHAICSVSGLANELADDEEEKLIRRITPFLLEVIRFQPELIDWLQS